MPAMMVQGCTSWAGKSWLVTALCRWFARQGVLVAPFKAQNMSNNARVLAGGGEIGTAQWLQARAAGVEPDVRMNPILVKPEHGGSQVVRLGQVDVERSRMDWRDRSELLWPTARDALDSLLAEFEVVVIEGAGSPAEINLADADIVNMRVAEHAAAQVLLTVDIDRGGAFAHLYGTWSLVGDEHRARIAGFVLNRFRGDPSLLPPGPAQLEALTGVPTVGVIPMIDHDLPDEDGAALHRIPSRGGLPRVAIVRCPTASNLDEFASLEHVADVRWATAPWHLDAADLIVLPGSKDVVADVAWLHTTGVAERVRQADRAGTPIMGICGGLQMLGRELIDGDGDDRSCPGLGLLPVTTTFAPDKYTARTSTQFVSALPGPWAGLAGRAIDGYEIRHGTTVAHASDLLAVLPTDRGWAHDNVLGVYLHGLFEDPDVLEALFGTRPDRGLEATFDLLADTIDTHLDTDHLRRLARPS